MDDAKIEFYEMLMDFYDLADKEDELRAHIARIRLQTDPMIEGIQLMLERGYGIVVDEVLQDRKNNVRRY